MIPHVVAQLLNREQLHHEVVDFGNSAEVFAPIQRYVVNVGAFADVVIGLTSAETFFREVYYTIAETHEVRIGIQRVHEVLVVKQLTGFLHDVVLERGGFQPHANLRVFLSAHALVFPLIAARVLLIHERRVFNLLGMIHGVDVLGNHEAQCIARVALFPAVPVERIPCVVLDADAHEFVFGVVVHHVRQIHIGGFLRLQGFFHVILVGFATNIIIRFARIGLGPKHDGTLGQATAVSRRVHSELLPLVVKVNDHAVCELGGLGAEGDPREEQVRARVAQRPTHANPFRFIVIIRGGQTHGI